ncbi:hypothetical protein ABEB36_014157 [Hypothenemus hampei]|uniref:Putative nuclease HARBI1 n=1 Tax=Hypothenemus hampei TaxID=57062 RepID=A0ABD1E3N4_HYPHA
MSDHFSSSDDDLEEFVNVFKIPKSINYFEQIVPQFSEQQYREHFRIGRQLTQQLANQFEVSEYYHYQEGDSEKITALKFITVFLWYAGSEAGSFRDVADRFDISKSSLYKIIRRVTYFLSNLSPQVIKWPTNEEQIEIEEHYRGKGFPGVVGIIDGTHIRIDKPDEDSDSYLNRKHFYSIQAQVVCDHKKRIVDIFVGYPGSVHDGRVFRNSPLSRILQEKCRDFYLLADSGYPCLPQMLTPFRDTGNLTRRQRNFNYILSKNRYVIEHCFGLLKQKLRQLYHIKLKSIPDIVHFIRSCAVLHNLAIDDEFIIHYEILPHPDDNPVEIEIENDEDDGNGSVKRNEVMNSLDLVI